MTYCFLDIETTGLDPDEDKILEISWLFTDDRFNVTYAPKTFVIEQSDWQLTWSLLNEAPEIVRKMHAESGLLAALANKDVEKTTMDMIYNYLLSDLSRESVGGLVHLAGRSVHFDKSFLLAEDFVEHFNDQQPASFHHRMLDLSAVNLMLASAGIATEPLWVANEGAHRAQNDIIADVRYAQNLREFLAEGIFA